MQGNITLSDTQSTMRRVMVNLVMLEYYWQHHLVCSNNYMYVSCEEMLLCNNTHPLLHIKYTAVGDWCMIVITP